MGKKKYIVSDFDDQEIIQKKEEWDRLDPKTKGAISESYTKAKLSELGFDVWIPYMNNHKADIGIIANDMLVRIQVKTASYDPRTKRFRAMLQTRDRGKRHIKYKAGDIDFFIVYCPHVHQFYVIPSKIGIENHSVNMTPHREKAIKTSHNDWELYKNAFSLIQGVV